MDYDSTALADKLHRLPKLGLPESTIKTGAKREERRLMVAIHLLQKGVTIL